MCDHHLSGKVCISDPNNIEPNATGTPVISLNAHNGDVLIGGPPGGLGHRGRLILSDAGGVSTYEIDGDTGNTFQSGDIVLLDIEGNERIRISGNGSTLIIKNVNGKEVIHLDGEAGLITVGGNGEHGNLLLKSTTGQNTIFLDGTTGEVALGGSGHDGGLLITNTASLTTILLDGKDGVLALRNNNAQNRVELEAGEATIRLRRPPEPPGIDGFVNPGQNVGPLSIELNGEHGQAIFGGGNLAGSILIKNKNGQNTIDLDGQDAGLTLGVSGTAGQIQIKNRAGTSKVSLNGQAGAVNAETGRFREVIVIDDGGVGQIGLDGNSARLTVGFDKSGEILIRNSQAKPLIHLDTAGSGGGSSNPNTTVYVDGKHGSIHLGSANQDGDIVLKNAQAEPTIHLDAAGSGGGSNNPSTTVYIDGSHGSIHLGSTGQDGDLVVKNAKGQDTIQLDGATGDIALMNADCAEEFEIAAPQYVDPGTVMVFDEAGKLQPSAVAYDKKVAGVISGAGDFKPGIVLDKQSPSKSRLPVALLGKVYCKVDARYGAIEVGDLLTTSTTPGHAMKASDPTRAFGAVLGKAINSLPEGQGLISVLVALQ